MQLLCVLRVNIFTTSPDKQAMLHFSFLKTVPWRHRQETPLFLWGQCSASCAKTNIASLGCRPSWSQRENSWGGPALVFTVYCKGPSPTGPRVLGRKCLEFCPCCIICTSKGTVDICAGRRLCHRMDVEAMQMVTRCRGTGRAWGKRRYGDGWCWGSHPITAFCTEKKPFGNSRFLNLLLCFTICTFDSKTSRKTHSAARIQENKCKWRNFCCTVYRSVYSDKKPQRHRLWDSWEPTCPKNGCRGFKCGFRSISATFSFQNT